MAFATSGITISSGMGSTTAPHIVLPADPTQQESSGQNASSRAASTSAQTGQGIIMAEGADEAASRLSYDRPSGQQNRAISAYQSVAWQQRREAVQQMVNVDLYA